jgi:hypothetical protein
VQLTLQGKDHHFVELDIDALPAKLLHLTLGFGVAFVEWLKNEPQYDTVTCVTLKRSFFLMDLGYFDRFPNLKHLQVTKFFFSTNFGVRDRARLVNLLKKWRDDNLRLEFTGPETYIFNWKNANENRGPCVAFQTFLRFMVESSD